MATKDALRSSTDFSSMVLKTYVSDLEDAELLRRPVPGCNHLAWQLGHLISSEVHLLEQVAPGKGIELPAGFANAHSKETCQSDDAKHFQSKQTYLDLFDQVRNATKSALENYADEDFAKPAPEQFRSFCPTMLDMFTLIALHPMMHAGQFVVIRRQLNKPVLI